MTQTAVLFKDGQGQAVRLPAEFRFDGTEVAIRKDEATGEVILSPTHAPRASWQEFFNRADGLTFPEDFLSDRDLQPATNRDLL
jgi:antitoxin VapB